MASGRDMGAMLFDKDRKINGLLLPTASKNHSLEGRGRCHNLLLLRK